MATPPPILCYHKIERRAEVGITRLSPRRFAWQMERLARDGWQPVGLREIAQCTKGEGTTHPKAFALTFDDAYRGLRDHAFPVLFDLGWSAICAVITDYAGHLNRWDMSVGGRRFAHLAWRDIERWAARGITFISHTATHPRLTWLDEPNLRKEYERSRQALSQALGDPPTAICYPWGAANLRERQIAQETGYTLGFVTTMPWRHNPMAVPRIPVYPWHHNVPRTASLLTQVISQSSVFTATFAHRDISPFAANSG